MLVLVDRSVEIVYEVLTVGSGVGFCVVGSGVMTDVGTEVGFCDIGTGVGSG